MDQLDRLVRMRKENYLNDSEFSAAKEKLLGLGQISELPNAVVFLPSGEEVNRYNPSAPPGARMNRGDSHEGRPADFSFDVSTTQAGCTDDRGIKFPRYVARQWGGRLTEAEYRQFEKAINKECQGQFQTNACCLTCFGCFLCICCAACEECSMEKVDELVDRFNGRVFQKRGLTIDATPVMQRGAYVKLWRFQVRFE